MAVGVEVIREGARELPDAPGVYLMHGSADEVLYVGKAKSLRKRVGSYARGDRLLDRKTLDLVARVASIESIVVESESEALFLEQNLVKRHRPAFNIRLRDDKSYPFIAVTVGERFPRVLFTRERHRRGVRYFGPYANASKVRETLDVLGRVFPFRPCEGPQPGRRSGVPCLDYHIGRCLAPCVAYVSEERYRELIDGVVAFLEGRTRPIERQLEEDMKVASAEQRFEDAARARNRLTAVRHLMERNLVDRVGSADFDVIAVASDGDVASVQVFPLRDGRLGDRFSYTLENAAEESVGALVLAAVEERYAAPSGGVPPLVCVPEGIDDVGALADRLCELRGGQVEVRVPLRGEKRRLLELATRNARHALEGARLQGERDRARRVGAIEELREALNLESLPLRIECFDVSNLGDQATVASMVVFEQGVAKRSDYRVFGIEHGQGQDDFASMAEAVRRRFTRLANPASAERDYDAGFAATPNLVVIDGGRGQLSAALGALDGIDLPRVAAIGLAKRIEEVFLPGRSDPIILAEDSPALLLLRRIRDEAHRFALRHHRERRSRAAGTESLFERLPGVGPARRNALLSHFGSPAAVLAASPGELEAVPGLPRATARQIHAFLHRAGGPGPA